MVRRFLPCSLKSPIPDDRETECLPSSVLRKFIHSLAYGYSLATLYASTSRSTDCYNASLSRPQNHPHVYYPHGTSPRIYTLRFLYYHAHHGWFNPFRRFCHMPELCAHCSSLHTHDLDAAGYDFPWGFGIGL